MLKTEEDIRNANLGLGEAPVPPDQVPVTELAARLHLCCQVLGVKFSDTLREMVPKNLGEMAPEVRVGIIELLEFACDRLQGDDEVPESPLKVIFPMIFEKLAPILEAQAAKDKAQADLINASTPMELFLERALDEAAKSLSDLEVPSITCAVTLSLSLDGHATQIEGQVKRAPVPRFYVIGHAIARPNPHTRQMELVEGKILETVFHGSQLALLSELRDVPKDRGPKLWTPGQQG